jgi:imidazolonepropionase-like amidohydrolase
MELQVTPPRQRRRAAAEKPKSLEEQAKERRTKLQALAEFFDEAKAYAKAKDAAGHGSSNVPARVPAWEAMLPYVGHQLPITVHADEVRQIQSAVDWALTNNYRIILAGGRDAWMLAGMLATNHIPVVYTHTFTPPTRDTEPYDIHFAAPAVLHKAGVPVTFSIGLRTFDAPLARNLPYAAAQAVAFGLPETEALKGLTIYPADLAGVANRLGTIEPGKDATLFASDGNILDARANVKRMWVAGHEVNLETRHTRLYDKYKARPK